MIDKKKKIFRFLGYLTLFAYMIGMLFLVVFLKKQAQDRLLSFDIANTMFDIYAISLGACLLIIMPFSINKNLKRVIILSFLLFAVLLGVAVYFKYYTFRGEVLGDLLYVFSGAMFYQGVKYSVKLKKGDEKTVNSQDSEENL